MSDMGRIVHAMREWSNQTGQGGSLDTRANFVLWLEEKYGVRWDGGTQNQSVRITDPNRYLFFVLKWP